MVNLEVMGNFRSSSYIRKLMIYVVVKGIKVLRLEMVIILKWLFCGFFCGDRVGFLN